MKGGHMPHRLPNDRTPVSEGPTHPFLICHILLPTTRKEPRSLTYLHSTSPLMTKVLQAGVAVWASKLSAPLCCCGAAGTGGLTWQWEVVGGGAG